MRIKSHLPDPIAQALAPFAPPVPLCPAGELEMSIDVEGVDLLCHFEYDEGYVDNSRLPTEPDELASMTLVGAYVRDVDVMALLSYEQVDEVERVALLRHEGADE